MLNEEENASKIQAENNSIVVGNISVNGDVSGKITIGHTIAYTAWKKIITYEIPCFRKISSL